MQTLKLYNGIEIPQEVLGYFKYLMMYVNLLYWRLLRLAVAL